MLSKLIRQFFAKNWRLNIDENNHTYTLFSKLNSKGNFYQIIVINYSSIILNKRDSKGTQNKKARLQESLIYQAGNVKYEQVRVQYTCVSKSELSFLKFHFLFTNTAIIYKVA